MKTALAAIAAALTIALALTTRAPDADAQNTWRGLVVAPEQRCSPYDSDDYRYPQSVEDRIIRELGGIYGPYTGRWFGSKRDTDIEHMVARSEAHDSGLCRTSTSTRRQFATDPLNLTLAGPRVNRFQKSDHDAAEWLPSMNQCWYAARTIQVRQRYNLTIDRREAAALDRVLAGCTSLTLVKTAPGAVTTTSSAPPRRPRPPSPFGGAGNISQWDDNGNGRITCAEAWRHGIAPVRRGHPAYPYMRDGDGDGIVCE